MWELRVSPEFEGDYKKLCSRNAGFKRAVDAKVDQILENPMPYKPRRAPLQGVRRVHVGGSFVLLFEPKSELGAVRLLRLAHHDEAYGV
ncbi:MAG: type II toxin-antitoxin system RelE/ParE family toxin [Thermoplasmata archaeon]|nr:type II toxin-antitoxin system RelE/ParE family toxin [Thermoplasmata archaeon]